MRVLYFITIWALFSIISNNVAFGANLPAKYERMFSKARDLEKEKNYTSALEEYEKIVARHPSSTKTLERIVYINMLSGKTKKAAEYARKAIGSGGKAPISYNIMGIIFENRKEFGKAEKYYLKAIEADPSYASAYNNAGNISLRKGAAAKAIEYYRRAIENEPDNPQFYNNSGLVYELGGSIEKAISEYRKALSIDKNFKTAAENLARAESKLSYPKLSEKERAIAKSIVKVGNETGFNLFAAFNSHDGSKTAIYDYKRNHRFIVKELNEKNRFNETIFAQMIFEHKKELETLLQEVAEAKNLQITGQGYIPAVKRPVFYVLAQYEKNNIPFEGIFTVISNRKTGKHILITGYASHSFYKRSISESFIKNVIKNM